MKEEFFKEIGSQLNHKRLKKGYSLEQVSSSSKIAIKYLTNIYLFVSLIFFYGYLL